MSNKTATLAALVTVLLVDSVQTGRQLLPAGTLQPFPPDEAERLLTSGAARVPPVPPVLQPAAEARTVSALSDLGTKFLRLKDPKKAADFAIELREPADLAEVTALEYRRDGGPRPDVLEALRLASDAVRTATG